jgi:hypothetical protein
MATTVLVIILLQTRNSNVEIPNRDSGGLVQDLEVGSSDLIKDYSIFTRINSRKNLAKEGQLCYFFSSNNHFPAPEAFMHRICAVVLCFLLFPLSQARAEFYRCIDKEGKEFFSNDKKQLPEECRDRARPVTHEDGRVSVSSRSASPASVAPSSRDEHKDKYGRDEEYWRRKAANLRLKLRKQQDDHDLVVRQIEEQSEERPRKTAGKKRSTALDRKKLKLEKEIAQTTRMLEVDLPEEARRADAYPGWLRE